MRRTYTRERYLDRVALIREHVPDVALTTDVIVGFPGETEADFEQTLAVCEEVGYDGAFTFIYSPRRGTEAATKPEKRSGARRTARKPTQPPQSCPTRATRGRSRASSSASRSVASSSFS